jgi:hypothetical protein
MSRLKVLAGKTQYRHVVIGIFVASVLICSFGDVALSIEYSTVFGAASQFIPHVLLLTKQYVSADARLVTVYVNVPNNSSRPVLLYEYGVILTLNNEFIAQRDVYPNLTLQPGSNETLVVSFTVTGRYAQFIIQAEQSGQWNWDIAYPMRFYVDWLFVMAQNFYEPWSGIQEVP